MEDEWIDSMSANLWPEVWPFEYEPDLPFATLRIRQGDDEWFEQCPLVNFVAPFGANHDEQIIEDRRKHELFTPHRIGGGPIEIEICPTMAVAKDDPYFFEDMCMQIIDAVGALLALGRGGQGPYNRPGFTGL